MRAGACEEEDQAAPVAGAVRVRNGRNAGVELELGAPPAQDAQRCCARVRVDEPLDARLTFEELAGTDPLVAQDLDDVDAPPLQAEFEVSVEE